MRRFFILLLVFLSTTLSAATPDFDKDWQAAQDYYNVGDYRNAAIIYERLSQSDNRSAQLYYNLGNTYFKNNQLGLAVLNFERALVLDPSMEDAAYNLNVAKAKAVDRIEILPSFFLVNWIEGFGAIFSSDTWAILAVIFLAFAAAAGLLWLLMSGALHKAGLAGLVVCGIFAVVSFLYSKAAHDNIENTGRGVVLSGATVVRSEANGAGTDAFTLHQATTFEFLNKQEQWSEIRIADGKRGWILNSDIASITPF